MTNPLNRGPGPHGRARRRRTVLAALLSALLAAGGVVGASTPAQAAGSALASETFMDSSVADARWVALGDACLTGAATARPAGTLGRCAKTNLSPAPGTTPGYLQLTDASNSSSGAALYDRAIPSAGGAQIDFEADQYGGTGADGIAFFLTDGAYSLTRTGAAGGGLGYSSLGGTPGVEHGYLGLGLDAYGTYSSADGAGCTPNPGLHPNSIVLRGPGDGNRGYCVLSSRPADTVVPGARLRASDLTSAKRLVRIVVSPTTPAAPNPTVTTSIDFTGDGSSFTQVSAVTTTAPPPATYKFGFAASTGSATDVHLVRQVSVQSVTPLGAINLVKSVDRTAAGTTRSTFTTGDRIPYQFVVTNTGVDPLTGVTVTDPRIAAVTCPATTLASADSFRCTGTYTVTAADAAAGSITNTATATGDDGGTPAESTSSTTVPTYRASLALTKSATPSALTADGQTISYAFTVRNTGDTPVTGVGVAETAFSGSGTAPTVTCPAAAAVLAPGALVTCTASYRTTQADIEAGGVTNTAQASGTANDSPVTSPTSSAASTTTELPSLAVVKSSDAPQLTRPGQTFTYSFLVTNTGNVAVKDVAVTERRFTGTGATAAPACPTTTLAAGAATTCTASYTTTQADIDAGEITNTAFAAASTNRTGTAVVSGDSSARAAVARTTAIALTGSSDPAAVTAAGQTVNYSYVVTNSGNTTLTGVRIDPGAFTGSGAPGTVTCPSTTLAVGASQTCTVAYTTTQADVERGSISRTVTAVGTGGGTDVASTPSVVEVTAARSPGLTVAKSATPTTVDAAGQRIEYSFLLRSTGNVALTDVAVEERAFSGTGRPTAIDCPATTLAVDAAMTCTASYTSTQADVDAGRIDNTARATAASSGGAATSPDATATVRATRAPALTLTHTTDPAVFTAAGQTIGWNIVVTNTGNTTLTDLTVGEQGYTGTSPQAAVVCPTRTLAPGASTTCTTTSRTTRADVEAGGLDAVAVATATGAGGPVAAAPAGAHVTAASLPALAVTGTITPRFDRVGDVVTITHGVQNTGNRDLTGIGIDVSSFSGSAPLGSPRCAATSLAVGEATTCTVSYTVTQADVDAGALRATATASGTTAQGTKAVSPAVPVTTGRTGGGALSLVKVATPATVTAAGQRIAYTFLVGNSGSVTAKAIAIDEGAFTGSGDLGAVTCADADLAPGARTSCTATYTATAADVDGGSVRNTATATALIDGTRQRSAAATATTTSLRTAALEYREAFVPTTVRKAGQKVELQVTVTNAGNVTLKDVTVSTGSFTGSGPIGAIECPSGALAAGERKVCTAEYTVTQADVDRGTIEHSGSATGQDGTTPVVSPKDTASTGVQVSKSLDIAQAADTARLKRVGQRIVFTITLTNDGDQSLTDPSATPVRFDGSGRLGRIVCPTGALAPGASIECTAAYTVTAEDLQHDALTLVTVATATGADGDRVRTGTAKSVIAPVEEVDPGAEPSAVPVDRGPDGGLAETGSSIAGPVGVGVLLLMLGAGLLIVRRRRRSV